MPKGDKYYKLTAYLKSLTVEKRSFSFEEIEEILGFKLPNSCYKLRQSWENSESISFCASWMKTNYRVKEVDLEKQSVIFCLKENLMIKRTKKTKVSKSRPLISFTNKDLDDTFDEVMKTSNYGEEAKLIEACFKEYPYNTDINIVAMKCGLIELTNNTNVSKHKSVINASELANIIVNIKDIDKRIEDGDPKVVEEIAKSNGKINLFSFASKYCCYHNLYVYDKNDYIIYDNILKKNLYKYIPGLTASKIEKWRKNFNYKDYNEYIEKALKKLNITTKNAKRKLDVFVWYNNRP